MKFSMIEEIRNNIIKQIETINEFIDTEIDKIKVNKKDDLEKCAKEDLCLSLAVSGNSTNQKSNVVTDILLDEYCFLYIRNKLTTFNHELYFTNGLLLGKNIYSKYKNAVIDKISETYPKYKEVCDKEKHKPQIIHNNDVDLLKEITIAIIDKFEDLLDEKDITIPDEYDDDKEPDNRARIYGETYYNLENEILNLLTKEFSNKE